MISDGFYFCPNLLRFPFDLDNILLLAINRLLGLIELINHGIELTLKVFFITSQLLSGLAHFFFMTLKILLGFHLLEILTLQLLFFLWEDSVVFEVFFDESLFFCFDFSDGLFSFVHLGKIMLHVVSELNVGLFKYAELIRQLLLPHTRLVFSGHEHTNFLNQPLVLLHQLLFVVFDLASRRFFRLNRSD